MHHPACRVIELAAFFDALHLDSIAGQVDLGRREAQQEAVEGKVRRGHLHPQRVARVACPSVGRRHERAARLVRMRVPLKGLAAAQALRVQYWSANGAL